LILRYSNNVNNSEKWGTYGYGGSQRSTQITELLSSIGWEINYIPQEIKTTRWSRYFQGLKFIKKYNFAIEHKLKMIGICGHSYQLYKESFKKHKGMKIFLLEESNNFISYYPAKEENFKILAVPQNLETLVINYKDFFSGKLLPDCLESEIQHLAKADAVFCISREEQWLLRLRGIKADFLPYYPPQNLISNLLEVRQARSNFQNEKTRFLILGSAHNKPTFFGIIEQIKLLQKVYEQLSFEVDVAGYDTEKLEPHFQNHPAFTLHGTVSSEKLRELMSNTKAILLHQSTGVGALTRIPDMLIAGIPIIANSHACRSAFGYSGVYCYENEFELADFMNQELEMPDILPRPVAAEKRFKECLEGLIE
jgi:hypothetical protein